LSAHGVRYLLAKHDQQGFSGRRVPDVDYRHFET